MNTINQSAERIVLDNGQVVTVGDTVNYGFYKNLKFVGTENDGNIVSLEDKNGNTCSFFSTLFQKYGEVIGK